MTDTTAVRQATARDLAVNGAILGVAAAAWFGWAQEAPPAGWPVALGIGSVLGLLIAVFGVVTARRNRASGSAMAEWSGRRQYYRTVGLEGGLIVVGAVALGSTHHSAYVAPWVLFVVGAHFLPLSRLFAIRLLVPAGVLLAVAAVVAVVVSLLWTVQPSAVAGAAGGVILAVFAVLSLQAARR